ncbi:MAG: hypothetical protein HZA31_10325 [Opitutae bacterium]|nr:hypothetical protein [Opitutae bacterium]
MFATAIRLSLGALFLAMGQTGFAADDLELAGILQTERASYVAFQSAAAPGGVWVPVGGYFDGYRVTHLDPATETVTLTAGNVQRRLRLRSAQPAAPGTAPALPPGVERNLRLLRTAAYQHFWDTATAEAGTADFVGPDRMLFRVEPVAGEDYSRLRFLLGADGMVRVVDATGREQPIAADEPEHLLVTADVTLAQISQRLRLPLARLGELNPGFDSASPGGSRRVRLR